MPQPPTRSRAALAATAAAAALLGGGGLIACRQPAPRALAPRATELPPQAVDVTATETVPTTPAPTTATTLEQVPAGATIDAGPAGLKVGSAGPAVAALEARLAQLRFNPGAADGRYDGQLLQAVMGFQKQQGLPRTGKADPATLAAVATAQLGAPAVPGGEPTRVEVDLQRQVAQFWRDGRLQKVIPVSTGNGLRYCVPADKGGGCDTAVTPGGAYRADRKIKGLRVSKLGSLYDPVYFYGGIALHGSPSIPPTPASHGCVRVPMWESSWVHANVDIGQAVYVVGGKVAPVPFGATGDDDVAVPAPAVPIDDDGAPAPASA